MSGVTTSPAVAHVEALLEARGCRSGNSWRCPLRAAHQNGDKNPSFSVKRGDRIEGAVMCCGAGCERDAILDALGLSDRELYDDFYEPKATSNGHGPSTVYLYSDANGHGVCRKLRYAKGARVPFSWERPDGSGEWVDKLDGIKPPLYRLPDVLRGMKDGETIYVVEGEKDADRLASAGIVATSPPHGAGTWWQEHTDALRGAANVIVIADRDEPGETHARYIASELAAHVGDLSIVQAKEGNDAFDHFAAGYGLDEFVPMLTASDETIGVNADLQRSQFLTGGSFILDTPDVVPVVWGEDDKVLWAQGEPLYIVGPPGVGKTTLVGQVVFARLGLKNDGVLGFPMVPGRKVLYLACDRPNQIARALGRLARPEDREALDDGLVVMKGPPPLDCAKHPELLSELVQETGADTLIIDSLKDIAIGLSEDDVGAGVNNAIQRVIAADVEVLVLHHQRKSQNGAKPKTLEDVYGSTWITAGAGSVVLLWGAAGDLLVELIHLKQPATEVGPLKLEHDHAAGTTTIYRGFDLLLFMRNNSTEGVTAIQVARAKHEHEPNDNERKKAQRELDRLVKNGSAEKIDGQRGGSDLTNQSARYFLLCLGTVAPTTDTTADTSCSR